MRSNPVSAVDRPREPRRRWTILSPVEIGRVERAFEELADDDLEKRAWIEQARVVFLTWSAPAPVEARSSAYAGGTSHSPTRPVPPCVSVKPGCGTGGHAESRRRARGRSPLGDWPGNCSSTEAVPPSRATTSATFLHPRTGGPMNHKRYADALKLTLKIRPRSRGRCGPSTTDGTRDHERGGWCLAGGADGSTGGIFSGYGFAADRCTRRTG
jgi:hypothetical protein